MTCILITGAGSGLGRALATEFANANTHLVLLDISMNGLKETELSLKDSRAILSRYVVDVADGPALQSCLRDISETIGSVDWVINCAGVSITGRALDVTPSQWHNILAVNLIGVTTITNHFLPGMLERHSGKIINIASMFGLLPAPSGIVYATSKHALVGFTRTLMVELQDSGVDVHLICPGFIHTDLFENATYIGVQKDAMLPDTRKMMNAREAAHQIVKGIAKGRQWIVFPFYVRLLWWIEWLFPRLGAHLWKQQWDNFVEKSRTSTPAS